MGKWIDVYYADWEMNILNDVENLILFARNDISRDLWLWD